MKKSYLISSITKTTKSRSMTYKAGNEALWWDTKEAQDNMIIAKVHSWSVSAQINKSIATVWHNGEDTTKIKHLYLQARNLFRQTNTRVYHLVPMRSSTLVTWARTFSAWVPQEKAKNW